MMANVYFILIILLLDSGTLSQSLIKEECILKETGGKGFCVNIQTCDYAKKLIKNGQKPQHCGGFIDIYPNVCCPKHTSEIKCSEYSDLLLNVGPLYVFNGNLSLAKEFPHMAVLGYGDKENVDWSCGGSLISPRYVLTAAHCINSRNLGTVKWVRLGDLDLRNNTDDAKPQNFTISKIHIHPQYKRPSHYHDIALLQLDREAVRDAYVKPACLHVEKSIPKKLIITGWGTVDYVGEKSSHLLKAFLNHVDHKTCNKSYSTVSKKRLASGILDDLQICAGHPEGQDTCPGDSGGPLQYVVSKTTTYMIVGVTSFGKGCGFQNSIGVYTRVSNYVKWIEDVVWPK